MSGGRQTRIFPSLSLLAPSAVPQATLRPMRVGLARMVAALRGAVAVAAVVAAVVGAVPPVSWTWLGPALALLCVWMPVYVAVAWTRGLRPWLVAVDLSVTAALALAVGHLVSAAALSTTLGWVSVSASVSVVAAQLGGAPAVSVPAGLLVAAAAGAGGWLGNSLGTGVTMLGILAGQTLVGAAVMVVAMRVERSAVRAFGQLQEVQATTAFAQARREDERAQLRMVHNGPLTILTMALHAEAKAGRPTATLRYRAAEVLDALPRLALADDRAGDAPVRLDERLSQVVVWYSPPLRISADLHPILVPAVVAEAITAAASEALENAVRYAATDRAAVELAEHAGVVRATVTDNGRGFDPAALPQSDYGFGVREDLIGRMAVIGGSVAVRSSPGAGTVVELEWRRG